MPVTPGGRALGVNFAPPDPRTWAYPHPRGIFMGAPRDIDLRPHMQPVGNQGQLGSCTGWAGTAALEAKLGDGLQRSALYVYYYDRQEDGTPPTQDAGATMLGLCKALKNWGAPPEHWWPYDISKFSQRPELPGLPDKIDAYYQVSGTGFALLQGLWAALEAGEAVPIAFYVYPSFERTGRDGKVPMVLSGERALGGHAITACGWFNDQSAPGGYGWVMAQNSWGEGFGDQGYVYLPSAYFTAGIVMEAWVISVSAPVPPEPTPEPEPDVDRVLIQNIRDIADSAWQTLDNARFRTRADSNEAAWGEVGMVCDEAGGPLAQIEALCDEVLSPKPPGPDPEPGPQFVSPFPAGAIYGKRKWLFGSLGVDGFCPRGTPVAAPADMLIEEVLPGQGISGGAEVIACLPDKSWAWRWRHVQAIPGIRVGQTVRQGQEFCKVMDTSLDMLCAPPVRGYPDGWQHWDFSVNKGTDRFSPQGGGGGNQDAASWLRVYCDYAGTYIEQTPGPPSCGMTPQEGIELLTPEGRRT